MELLDAIILGIVQGLTEFLPVSSSGHLELVKALLGTEGMPEEQLAFTVMLHFATALSTLVIFRKEVFDIFMGLGNRKDATARHFSAKILVSMIPAVYIGLNFDSLLEQLFSGKIMLVGSMLLLTAGLLFVSERTKQSQAEISYIKALFIGLAQGVAILPGISRSGATIATALLLQIDKEKAARFSFLMVIPLILGKVAKDFLSGEVHFDTENTAALLLGFIAAFISGLLACRLMLRLVKKSKLYIFALYCALVGGAAILLSIL